MIGITLEHGEYGPRAVLTTAWSDDIEKFLRGKPIAQLELNHAKGWVGNDLSFLSSLTQLRAFRMIDFKIPSVQPIHFLTNLRALQVSTYCKTKIDFSKFPQLEDCGLEWRPGANSLFDCNTLRRLVVSRYDGRDTESFGKLINLESLAILNAPIENLNGLSRLKNLRTLSLGNLKRLQSLAGTEKLDLLEELEIHTCIRVHSIEPVGSLKGLRKFHLNNDGDIESLKPLNNLSSLVSVLFYESTNIVDGDVSPLLRQKKSVPGFVPESSALLSCPTGFRCLQQVIFMAENHRLLISKAAERYPNHLGPQALMETKPVPNVPVVQRLRFVQIV
jgi:hypothetical protein